MFRSSRRAEAARKKASSPAEDFVHTAAGRVGPLAQSAADRVGPLAEAAADALAAAADKVSPLAHSAANRIGPMAQSAADRVGPMAQSAADRIAPLAVVAVERVSPYADRVAPLAQSAAGYAQVAADRLTPLATNALQRGSQVTSGAVGRITPVLNDAVVKVSPAVTAARGRVTEDLLPKITVALSAAAANPLVGDARSRAEAALAAARGELRLPEKNLPAPRKPRGRWVRRIAIVGAVGAVAVVVVRRFVAGGGDADWQAARPSTPYVPPTTPSPTGTGGAATAGVPAADAVLADDAGAVDDPEVVAGSAPVEEDFAAAEPAPVGVIGVNDAGDIEETVVDEVVVAEPVADLPETEPVADLPMTEPLDSPLAEPGGAKAARWSGEGVYVGSEPPAGFVIKGNERSMKYHMPEAAGYSRTIGEVWFNSEEAAQRAGFVRAQR